MKHPRSKTPNPRTERYALLAMSVLKRCDVSLAQLRTVSLLVANMIRNPPVTIEERSNERTLLCHLLDTVEHYTDETEAWRELVDAVVSDAKRLPVARLDVDEALQLMERAQPASRRAYVPEPQAS